MSKETVATDQAPQAIGPYSQAVWAGGFLFLSGQIPLDPATGSLKGDAIAEQAEQVMDNIAGVLAAAGLDFRDVVKSTIYLVDLADFSIVNEIYGKRFPSSPPARSTVEVKGLPRRALVEIEMIAWRG